MKDKTKAILIFTSGLGIGILIGWFGLMSSMLYVLTDLSPGEATSFNFGRFEEFKEFPLEVLESENRDGKIWAKVKNSNDDAIEYLYGDIKLFDNEGKLVDVASFSAAQGGLKAGETNEFVFQPMDNRGRAMVISGGYEIANINGQSY